MCDNDEGQDVSVSSHEQLPLSVDGVEDLHVLHVHVSFAEQELRAGTDIEES